MQRRGVKHLYLFGSTARGEARPNSDIDLFFDYEHGTMSLFDLMDLKDYAAQLLGQDTDIMSRSSLHPALQKNIEQSAVVVF